VHNHGVCVLRNMRSKYYNIVHISYIDKTFVFS